MKLAWMFLLHVIADYNLQGIMASLKQKIWWTENEPSWKYKRDFVMPLIAHSFEWSFLIALPFINIWTGETHTLFIPMLVINTIIHSIVDHGKVNLRAFNLIADQLLHALQVVITYIVLNYSVFPL